jgi:hypothetical protein
VSFDPIGVGRRQTTRRSGLRVLIGAALGLRAPIEKTLGTRSQVQYGTLCGALEEDASALADAFSRGQQEPLGIGPPPTLLDRAMWWDDPDHIAWRKAEVERARRLVESGHDQSKLAAELRPP